MYSDDFRNWTRAKEVFRVDSIDAKSPVLIDEFDALPPTVDLYTPGGMKLPEIPNSYILLPTAYYHWRKDDFPSNIDVRLATSRTAVDWWQHPDREPFMRLGPDGTASAGMIFANPWPIPVKDETWIYYAGIGASHSENAMDPSLYGIFRARMRREGFISVDAPYSGGEFTTPALEFSGNRLFLDIDGSAGGWLRVEILHAGGDGVSPFTIKSCDTVRGNSLRKEVTWEGKSDLTAIKDTPIQLHFVMRSMKLYSFQFSE